jgi:hypothetical protein
MNLKHGAVVAVVSMVSFSVVAAEYYPRYGRQQGYDTNYHQPRYSYSGYSRYQHQPQVKPKPRIQQYVGLGVGLAMSDRENATSYDLDDKDVGFNIFYGLDYTPNIAVEFSYANLGKYELSGDTLTRTTDYAYQTFGISGLLKVGIGKRAQAFARLGVHLWDVEYNGFSNPDDSSVDIFGGVGLDVKITGSLFGRVEYNRYDIVGLEIGTEDNVDYFAANVIYKF